MPFAEKSLPRSAFVQRQHLEISAPMDFDEPRVGSDTFQALKAIGAGQEANHGGRFPSAVKPSEMPQMRKLLGVFEVAPCDSTSASLPRRQPCRLRMDKSRHAVEGLERAAAGEPGREAASSQWGPAASSSHLDDVRMHGRASCSSRRSRDFNGEPGEEHARGRSSRANNSMRWNWEQAVPAPPPAPQKGPRNAMRMPARLPHSRPGLRSRCS